MSSKRMLLLLVLAGGLFLSGCQPSRVLDIQSVPGIEQTAEISVEYPGGLAWSADSSMLYAYSYNQISQIDVASTTITVQRVLPEGTYLWDVNGKTGLYIESTDAMTVAIRRVDTGELVQTLQYPTYVNSAVFSPNGESVAVSSGDAWLVDIFDVATGGIMDSLTGFETAAPVYGVQYSRDGASLLYFARATLQPQDISSHQMGTAMLHEDFISTFTSSPDGQTLVSAAAGMFDNELSPMVFLWDRRDGTQIARLPLTTYITCMDFSPEGKILLLAGADKVYFARPDSLEIVFELDTTAESISAVRISPDGTRLAIADSRGEVTLWGLP